MAENPPSGESTVYDYVIIGSGFGGSISAMRLAEKGYSVLVLERGKRWADRDFPKTNWNIFKWLWLPAARCFGIFEMTFMNGLLALHGSGVGGGSLVYANVLMEPDDRLFDNPAWRDLADWKKILRPYYDIAKQMLGVARNPLLWPADHTIKQIADKLGRGDTFEATTVGVFFGDDGKSGETVPDPFFGGEGPSRAGCIHCGGCMVGCRHNSKNTLVKNYLYFAEKWGALVHPEIKVRDIRPLPEGRPDDARYEILTQSSTGILPGPVSRFLARKVIVSAGVLGTLELLYRCRDVTRSLPKISPMLGERVRTNSESLLGVSTRHNGADYSKGVAITSVFHADDVTRIEPVRFSDGSGFIRTLSAPLIQASGNIASRIFKTLKEIVLHPLDFLNMKVAPRWANRTTIFLVMQTEDNLIRMKLGRGLFTIGKRGVVIDHDVESHIPTEIEIGSRVTREFAQKVDGVAAAAFTDSLFNFPSTAHILGGVPMGRSADDGVVSVRCEVFNYPGLYVVDGSIMPANPGINPSLTIAALAEYAMNDIPAKPNGETRRRLPIGY